MIAQQLKKNGSSKDQYGRMMANYLLEDGSGALLATVHQASKDASIHRVCWFGGVKHGKVELTADGIEGLMEFVAL